MFKRALPQLLSFSFTVMVVVAGAQRGSAAAATNSVLITKEGIVEYLKPGTSNWISAEVNQTLATGQRLRTGERSRATVLLTDLSVLRINEVTTIEIQPPSPTNAQPTLDLRRGGVYFFNRDRPQEYQLRTPVASGGIRGTEFNADVADNGRTVLTLLDGAVELTSTAGGAVLLKSGEEGAVEQGRPPTKTAAINATNVIQWTLYYPAILDPKEIPFSADETRSLSQSLSAYRAGDLLAAADAYRAGGAPGSDAEKLYAAALALVSGQVSKAEDLLQGLRAGGTQAEALRELIAAVKFQPFTRSSPAETASALMAESYYQQSRSNLRAALDAARAAAAKSPDFSFAQARVAELEFSFGHSSEALAALDKSLAAGPRNAEALALKGFLLASQGRYYQAHQTFDQAIALDGALGNAWLGRGLLKIRHGDAKGGREDLQIAASLEPNRALLRSYLGKAYSNAGDSRRATEELAQARRLDPNDPTSWLYSALLNRQNNRVNEAVHDLEKSVELNNNRSVFRSGFLLDQDRAVRSANLAGIYRDAGMQEVSVREATRAVNSDYANYSAHLFLANSYNELRDPKQLNLRYETPWFNELLLANLLAPPGAGSLSQNISQQEYSRLFEGDHFGALSRTEWYSSGDWVESATQYGTAGKTSYALDSYYRSENGQRPNNDQRQLTLSAQVKQQITPQDSLFLQGIYYDFESGNLTQYYNQRSGGHGLRVKENQEPILLAGYNHEWGPGIHTLVLAGRLTDRLRVDDPNTPGFLSTAAILPPGFVFPSVIPFHLNYESELEIYTAELEQIWQQEHHTLIVGGRYQIGTFDTESRQSSSSFPSIVTNLSVLRQDFTTDMERIGLYGYYSFRPFDPLLFTAGLAYDRLFYPRNFRSPPLSREQDDKDQISPKLGLTWTPARSTTVRASYTRSLGGVSYDQSFRLEPSQVAGFNQAFRSIIPESLVGSLAGAEFETKGIALDQNFNTGTYLTVEGTILNSEASRKVGVYNINFGSFTANRRNEPEHSDFEEKNLNVTVNQLLGKEWVTGLRYRLTHAELEERFPRFTQTLNAYLHQLDGYLLFNLPCGFFARGDAIWSQQSNRNYSPDIPGDDFWQFSAFVGYRFPKRLAEVQLGLLNITDRDYQLNPLTVYNELPRERTLFVSFKFNF